jgi:hypothetical protein
MTQSPRPQWEQTLWDELNQMTPDEQIIASGQWITHISRELLTELGAHRRRVIAAAVREPGMDDGRLADRLGSRRSTISRLAEEGRALLRDEARHQEEPIAS